MPSLGEPRALQGVVSHPIRVYNSDFNDQASPYTPICAIQVLQLGGLIAFVVLLDDRRELGIFDTSFSPSQHDDRRDVGMLECNL